MSDRAAAPQFVAVGHITRDMLACGERVGGTVTFAALTARRLDLRAAVVTSAGPDLDWATTLAGIEVICVPGGATTAFANEYAGGARRQRLLGRATPLRATDVPQAWRSAPYALIGPVAGECAPDLVDAFPAARIAVTPQGWLRTWDASGRVRFAAWPEAPQVLPRADVTVLSREDVAPDADLIERYAALAPCLVVTDGENGADVHWRGRWTHVPALARPARDPTGAGDVFATAFLIELGRGGDALAAARFAHAAASFVVEAGGAAGIPGRRQIEARLAAVRA
jgi:sugar/nucleoside kinase (ribokinase family)